MDGELQQAGRAHAPELLAPAGNMTCLHAAVRAGADAVYLGTSDFNARRGADNFTIETLAEACAWAHLRGVRVYLTLNTVVLPSEVGAVCKLVAHAWEAGVDAFIVQDIGLAAKIARDFPQVEMHVSTQMNTHNAAGVQAAAALGATRVTLARELELTEVAHLCDVAHDADMQVEVFAHGALCVCYSGQCFASSLVGGRSANRGMCAQVCRLPYELHASGAHKPLDAPGEHLLSPKDLSTIDLLLQLVAAGVDSLKIEGRMKSPEYVFSVVSVYRSVLDRAVAAQNTTSQAALSAAAPTSDERQGLEEAFSRGFTQAYLAGERGNTMMSYTRPNNRGVFAGRVVRAEAGVVQLDCELELAAGDVIEFWTNKGHFAHSVSALAVGKQKGRYLLENVERPVGKGDRVFRVRSAAMAFEDSVQEPRVPVCGTVELCHGQPARLVLSAEGAQGQAVSAHAEGAMVEAARTKAITEDEVREHIDRFGNTPFVLSALDVHVDEGVGLGFSTLHKLRAQASDMLQQNMLAAWCQGRLGGENMPPEGVSTALISDQLRCSESSLSVAYSVLNKPEGLFTVRSDSSLPLNEIASQSCRNSVSKPSGGIFSPPTSQRVTVCAWVTNAACGRAARKAGADDLYVPALNYKRGQAVMAGQRSEAVEQAGYPKQAVIALPTIDKDAILPAATDATPESERAFDPWGYLKPGKPVFADSLGAVMRALAEGFSVEVGPHVPVTNALTAAYFEQLGVSRIWLSPELTLGQIQRIAEECQVPLGLFVSGAAELMITEHCLLMSQGPCNQDCETCPRRAMPHYLKDRKGFEMPAVTDLCGRSHLYNAVSLDLCHLLPDLASAGVSACMVDTTLLNVKETSAAVARAVRARDLFLRTGAAADKRAGTTTGHIFRSVS